MLHLVGEPRTCCGHLLSGTGSRFVREMSEAAHPYMRFGLLRTLSLNPAHAAARQGLG